MKKVYSVLIALILILGLFSSIAYAQSGTHEKIDLTDYSLEELIELHEDVRAELIDRLHLSEDSLIGRGNYTVGSQIKPGTYTLTVAESDEYEGDILNTIRVFVESTHDYPSQSSNIPVGGKVVVTLEDGQELQIVGCSCYVSVSNPVWAP